VAAGDGVAAIAKASWVSASRAGRFVMVGATVLVVTCLRSGKPFMSAHELRRPVSLSET
jgi:hypothetical protein